MNENSSARSLALCERFCPSVHGIDNNSSPTIRTHFLIHTTFELEEFTTDSYKEDERRLRRRWRKIAHKHEQSRAEHQAEAEQEQAHAHSNNEHSNNEHSIQYNKIRLRLDIIQTSILNPGGEEVAIIKTFWLKIVQRCWKKVFKQRKELIQKRSAIKALQERQRTGKWSLGLRNYPAFKLNLKS